MTINEKINLIKQFIEDHAMPWAKEEIETDGSAQPKVYLFLDSEESVEVEEGTRHTGSMLEFGLSFVSNAQKRRAYAAAAKMAAERKAFAAVIVNDAYMKTVPADSPEAAREAIKNYKPGDLSKDYEATECLIVSAKGPGLPPSVVAAPYRRNDLGDIEWLPTGLLGDYSHVEVNLMPDWWES